MNVIEFHATNFLQLLFDTTAYLQRIFQTLPYIFFIKLTVWVEQLHQSGNRLANCDHITLIQVVTELEVLLNRVCKATLTHFPEEFSQIINNQAITVGKEFRAHFWNFPTRDIGMKAIKEC